jgi:hypothetical protein
MKTTVKLFLTSAILFATTYQIEAASKIDPEFDKPLLVVQKLGTKYKQQVAAFSVFDGEVVAYAMAYKAARDAESEAAQVAAYDPLFEGYKEKAKLAVATLIQTICPDGDDTVPFLHDEIVVGDDQPANHTRAGFIAWLKGRINTIYHK